MLPNFKLHDKGIKSSKQYGIVIKTDTQISGTNGTAYTVNLQQRNQERTMGKEQSSINGVGKTRQLHVKG